MLALGLSACTAENSPSDLNTAASGQSSVVFLRVKSPAKQDELVLARFDLPHRNIAASVLGGFITLHLDQVSDHGFVWHHLEPGTYVVEQFSHQIQWNLCFTKETRVFSILPGQKLYLGELDPLPLERELASEVLMNGDIRLQSNLDATYQVPLPPVLNDPHTSMSASERSLQVSSQQTVQDVVPADYQTMPFNPFTRTALLTGKEWQHCGDWLRG
jgi:hypothetical protein